MIPPFVCPNCGGNGLERITTGVTVYDPIKQVYPNGTLDLGVQAQSIDDGGVDHIACDKCGWEVLNVYNGKQLWKFLQKQTQESTQ